MKINLAKSSGFCFGVKRALQIALQGAKNGRPIEMFGDLVHNEEVVKKIEKSGIKKIKRLTQGKGKMLLIPAHGAANRTIDKAIGLGYEILDATCPMVKEIHKIAQSQERRGYNIVIIGDKKHDEVNGIVGQLKGKTTVIDSYKNIPLEKVKKLKKLCIVVQSTQNEEEAIKIVKSLRRYVKETKFFNTICNPTKTKQKEMKVMPLENDAMIIIGSKTSANTKRLFEISKRLNKRSYWVQSKKEIKPQWFRKVKTLGIASGASTADSTTKSVIEYINRSKI